MSYFRSTTPPPPPEGLSGRFLYINDRTHVKDLMDISQFSNKEAGTKYREVKAARDITISHPWVFRPYQRYVSDDYDCYMCPVGDGEYNKHGIYFNKIINGTVEQSLKIVIKKQEVYPNLKKDDYYTKIELTNEE